MNGTQGIPIIFVTAGLEVFSGTIGAAGKSGGCGFPVATQWMVDPDSVRPITPAEREEHADLIAELLESVGPRIRFDNGQPYIAADVLLHARIGFTVTGRTQWGRSDYEFWGVLNGSESSQ